MPKNRQSKKLKYLLLLLIPLKANASIFGEENIALLRLVVGQIAELEKLTEALGVAKENRAILLEINEGIGKVVSELDSVDEIVRRSKNLNPKSIRKISDLTNLINDTKALAKDIDALTQARLVLTEEAIVSSGIQSGTAYEVGREMIKSGSLLSKEARSASPGRAAQISAAASSNQMIANGALLQTLAQISELQAIELDLKKGELERDFKTEAARKKATGDFLKGKNR